MSIATIYRVSLTLPENLTRYLASSGAAECAFEADMLRAFSGHLTSGSNTYSGREEWAEFDNRRDAEIAQRVARFAIVVFHNCAIRKGF